MFHFLNADEIEKLDILSLSDDSPTGMIVEVDIEYPKEFHDLHSDYPLAPEKQRITN